VTGARKELTGGLAEVVERIRRHTELPILVGFGISRREHVEAVGQLAEGAVVASALLDAIDKVPREQVLETAHEFVRSLRTAGG
jgi:tryptophan synthase alpha subunit